MTRRNSEGSLLMEGSGIFYDAPYSDSRVELDSPLDPLPPRSRWAKCLTGLRSCLDGMYRCGSSVVNFAAAVGRSTKNVFPTVAFHTMDFLRIYFVTLTLFSRWVQALFVELKKYNEAPSIKEQQDWTMGIGLFSGALAIAAASKIVNACGKCVSQDHVFAFFSSSLAFMVADLLSKDGKSEMSIKAYLTILAISALAVAAFFLKITLPDSAKKMTTPRMLLNKALFNHPNASYLERFLNALSGAVYVGAALAAAFWVWNREYNGKTVPAPVWQLPVLVSAAAVAGIFAAITVTDYPKAFHVFAASSKALKEFALTYAAYSGIMFNILKNANPELLSNMDEVARAWIIGVGLLISGSIAAFTGLYTEVDFKGIHTANEEIAGRAGRAKAGLFALPCCRNKDEAYDDVKPGSDSSADTELNFSTTAFFA